MQKLIETLKQFGIEVPTEKHAEVKKALSEHYKNVAEHTKAIGKLETERDSWKERAETAEKTLEGLDGKSLEDIKKERDDWKKKAEDAVKEYSEKEAEREKRSLIEEAMAGIEFTSESAKKAITAQIYDGVSVKNGKLIGFNDLLEDAKKNDSAAFANKNTDTPKITSGTVNNNNSGSGVLTEKEISAIKDTRERQKAWADKIAHDNGINKN